MGFSYHFRAAIWFHTSILLRLQIHGGFKDTEDDYKFMFMYLHSPHQPFTPSFCTDTLCSKLVVQFLDANFVSWGTLADREEGSQMAATLVPASFPCCSVVAPVRGNSIAVLQQIEGPISPAELVEILQRTIEEQGSAFRHGRGRAEEEEKIRTDRRPREEQDAAYLAALRIDKEKEKSKNLLLPEKKKFYGKAKQASNTIRETVVGPRILIKQHRF